MHARYVDPFLQSLTTTFDTMLKCSVRCGPVESTNHQQIEHGVCGIIGVSGKAAGSVVLKLSENVALKATEAMLMCEVKEMNADVEGVIATGVQF